ncbi:MAG: anthranilate phosphoribosyltransferase [Terriglobia bacterium]
MYIASALEKLSLGGNLTRPEARGLMSELLSGRVPDDEIVAVLAAFRDKGETFDEVAGLAEVMREQASAVLRQAGVDAEKLADGGPLLDTCGTGGDGKGTFNVSTATALVAAAAGARVAKHGNRSISSRAGSADVLEALGVSIEIPLCRLPECLERTGFVFLYAPHLHLAMKHVMNARRQLKGKTVFNLLGPLTNPLGASAQLAGVYDRTRTEMMARALAAGGALRAFVVASHGGMDEISISGPTQLSEARDGTVTTRDIVPEQFGFSRASGDAVGGGSAAENAAIIRRVLDGERSAYRDMALVNTSAALVVAGLAPDFVQGVRLAAQAVDSGMATRTLEALQEFTQAHCA